MRHALSIGINKYSDPGNDLAGCEADARDWQAALKARGFVTSLILDDQATGAAMRAALAQLVETAKPGDSVVITYSGHGTFVPDEDGDEADGFDEALCPHDIAENGVLTDDELAELFEAVARDVRIVLISDSCHSGTVARFANTGGTQAVDRVRFLPPSTFDSRLASLPRTVRPAVRRFRAASSRALLIAGCQDSEYSYDAWFDGKPNGAFTRFALQCLPPVKDPQPSYKTWFRDLRRFLPSSRHPQTPNLVGSWVSKRWTALG